MTSRTSLIASLLLLTLAMAPAAQAGWIHQENSVFQAEKATQKHPKTLDQTLVLPRAAVQPQLCVAYTRDEASNKRSKVVTRVGIESVDGSFQVVKLIARVRDDKALKCKDLGASEAGTVFTFRHTFKKMPRVRRADGNRQSVVLSAFVSTVGEPRVGKTALSLTTEAEKAPLGLGQGEDGGWFHSANSVFYAEQNGTPHPRTLDRVIEMSYPTGPQPLVCTAYNRSSEIDGGGQGRTAVTIARQDGSVETLSLTKDVGDGSYLTCKSASREIAVGDLVSFEADFENMPAIGAGSFADLIAAVSTAGRPKFGRPSGGGGGGGDSGPPVAGLTIADEFAAARMIDGRNRQLVLERDANPTKFLVFGPGTRLDGNRKIIPSTVGYGNVIADALADYERKQGSLGGTERRLTPSEIDSILYFSRINASGGGTAIRKDANGGFHCDLYRPALGVRVGGPFGSLAATINWIKSLGL